MPADNQLAGSDDFAPSGPFVLRLEGGCFMENIPQGRLQAHAYADEKRFLTRNGALSKWGVNGITYGAVLTPLMPGAFDD